MYWILYSLRSLVRRFRRSGIIFAGMSVSLMILVFLGALMTGVNDRIIDNALSLHGGTYRLEGTPGPFPETVNELEEAQLDIQKLLPETIALRRVSLPVLLKERGGSVPVFLNAVDPEDEMRATPLFSKVVEGEYLPGDGLLISRKTAQALGVELGDKVLVFSTGAGFLVRITGIYESGIDAFDTAMAFIRLHELFRFKEIPLTPQLILFTDKTELAAHDEQILRESMGDYDLKNWKELRPDVLQLVELNRASMFVMIFLVVLIIGFSMASLLLGSVVERNRQFAVMKTLGTGRGQIIAVITGEALFLSLFSALTGSAAGILMTRICMALGGVDLSAYTSQNPNFALNSMILPRLEPVMVILPALCAVMIGTLASFWPSWRVVGKRVVIGMRNL